MRELEGKYGKLQEEIGEYSATNMTLEQREKIAVALKKVRVDGFRIKKVCSRGSCCDGVGSVSGQSLLSFDCPFVTNVAKSLGSVRGYAIIYGPCSGTETHPGTPGPPAPPQSY